MTQRTSITIDSVERLLDTLYLPAEYPGQQRFLCISEQEPLMPRLTHVLARRMAERVPAKTMGVHMLGGLDWSSRQALVDSLIKAMQEAAPSLCARVPKRPNGNMLHKADVHLRWLMDPPDDVPDRVLTFLMTIPDYALRPDMRDFFFQFGALISSSDHNWVVMASPKIVAFGTEDLAYMSPFHSYFEAYELCFSLADLPEEDKMK